MAEVTYYNQEGLDKLKEELQQLKAKLEQEEGDPQEPEVNQERELSEEELFLQAIEDLSKRSKD